MDARGEGRDAKEARAADAARAAEALDAASTADTLDVRPRGVRGVPGGVGPATVDATVSVSSSCVDGVCGRFRGVAARGSCDCPTSGTSSQQVLTEGEES
mmetsp:Transcript_2608/g.7892  ORF Transcript_2608/g.7892 Transcript_2608/m.7892 type:complete len:100 (-) Transcript_2608:158-457(-)